MIKSAFSFLSSRSQGEERIAQYVIREHHRGRPLAEILEDPYVTNRCTPEQIERLLDRPDIVHALGEDLVADAKTHVVLLSDDSASSSTRAAAARSQTASPFDLNNVMSSSPDGPSTRPRRRPAAHAPRASQAPRATVPIRSPASSCA